MGVGLSLAGPGVLRPMLLGSSLSRRGGTSAVHRATRAQLLPRGGAVATRTSPVGLPSTGSKYPGQGRKGGERRGRHSPPS